MPGRLTARAFDTSRFLSDSVGSWEGGGGGGGGWFGGGGGRCQSNLGTPSALNLDVQNGGGGGGSSYFAPTASSTVTSAGANFLYANVACAGTATSGGSADPYYVAGIGLGSCYGNGGNGLVIIQYNSNLTITLTKTSQGGTGSFTFTGNNGWSSQIISTTSAGVGVAGAAQKLSASSTATTITETSATGFVMTSGSCTGLGSAGTATINVLSGTIALDAAATATGAAISCSVTNAVVAPALSIDKSYSTAFTPVQLGQTIIYSYAVTNTGNVIVTNIQVKDMHGSPATQIAIGGSGIKGETLSAAGPHGAGSSPDITANDGIWSTLAPGATVTFTYTHTVTQAEIDHG